MEATESKRVSAQPDPEPQPHPQSEAPTASIDMQDALKKLRNEVDNLNLDLSVEKARNWVKDHPVLATAAALGVGLLAASLVVSLLDDEEEIVSDQVSDRVKRQVASASRSIEQHASVLKSNLSDRAEDIGEKLFNSVEPLLHSEGVASVKSSGQRLSTSIVDTVKAAAAAAVVQKFSDWIKRFSK